MLEKLLLYDNHGSEVSKLCSFYIIRETFIDYPKEVQFYGIGNGESCMLQFTPYIYIEFLKCGNIMSKKETQNVWFRT